MRTYFVVPFEHSSKAKSLGARFDLSKKQWFCPDGVDLALFRQWLPEEIAIWFDTAAPVTSRRTFQRSGSHRPREGPT